MELIIVITLALVAAMIAVLLYQAFRLNTPLALLQDELAHLACFHELEDARKQLQTMERAAQGRADAEDCGLVRRIDAAKTKVKALTTKYANHTN